MELNFQRLGLMIVDWGYGWGNGDNSSKLNLAGCLWFFQPAPPQIKRRFGEAISFADILDGEASLGLGVDDLQPEPAFFRVIKRNKLVGNGLLFLKCDW
jgi:hypothetical protein